MTADKTSVLLGRPLSVLETTNYKTYISLAEQRVSDILCSNICPEHDTKRFMPRDGYRTLNVPIFTEITSLTANDVALDEDAYTVYQGSSLYGDWFNTIMFDQEPRGVVEIEADWGFSEVPNDVQLMMAEQFAMMSVGSLDDDRVSRKQVEDFSIAFNGTTKSQAFATKYAATIAKYSACVSSNVQHGNTYYGSNYGHLQ